jgi:hypothetical protein
MTYRALFAALAALTAPSATLAAEPIGAIKLCRYPPGVVELMDRKSVPVPTGTGFVSGHDEASGDSLKPSFSVVTIEDAVLPPKPGCVTIRAKLIGPAGFSLTRQYPTYLPTDLNVAGLSVVGRVEADFR